MSVKSGIVHNGKYFKSPVVLLAEEKALVPEEPCMEGSKIADFFKGKNVLITGATGFLGKALIEKILRVCGDVEGIYAFIRNKKGEDVHSRMDKVLNDTLYERVSRVNPKYRHKVIPIQGDMTSPGLGLAIEDRITLTSKVNVILHCAATVRFDEALPKAYSINVKGTQEMIKLAQECKDLKSFVHVSTAYAHCARTDVGEEFYPVPVTTNELEEMIKRHTDEEIEELTPKILGRWPNTYAFTKALAENWVRDNCEGLPVCVFRPSIVIATYKEPFRGWQDNFYGPAGVCFAAGIGLLRVLHCNGDNLADLVPADYVVNAILATSYKTSINKDNKVMIYNYVTSNQQPLKWSEYMYYNQYYGLQVPSQKTVWYYNFRLINNYYIYTILKILLHFLPALLVDGFCLLVGKKPLLWNGYKKIHKFSAVISYFSKRQWFFSNDNVMNLWDGLNDVDQKVFPFDMTEVDWDHHLQMNIMGLRTYVLKEEPSTVKEMMPKWKLLHFFDTVITYIVYIIFLRIIYGIIMSILY